ncbi:histidine phosphatase superfamily [Pavlovales sp. CCMP2436]|nr:histidine phosphatase superfamily [Pavlovales sp. CCMP2436]
MSAGYAKSQEHLLVQSEHNPLPTELPPPIAALGGNQGDMHVVVLIGLPEVGKPFLAKRMRQYLRFFHGADCELFDICDQMPTESVDTNSAVLTKTISDWMQFKSRCPLPPPPPPAGCDGEAAEAAGVYKGQKAVDSGRCAIVYGSNSVSAFEEKWSGSSKERRRWIQSEVKNMGRSVKLIFVEVKVTDPSLVRRNIQIKRQALGENETSEEDYRRVEASIRAYAKLYVTLQQDGSEEDMSYVIFINYGQKVVTNRMHGFLRMRIAQFLSTIHTETHTIYLTRHGQSEYNRLGKIGGNSGVTEYGLEYARRLAKFAEETICKEDGANANKARLWTSSMRRTNETSQFIEHPEVDADGDNWLQMSHRVYRNLDEIFAGEYEGLTYEEVASRHQDEAFLRKVDKIGYRYPLLLPPYAYFKGSDRMDAPRISIPLHTVIKLTYNGWAQCCEEQVYLGPDVPKNEQST